MKTKTKPCIVCGQPKRAGHPRYCSDCWIERQPMDVQVTDAQQARAAMLSRLSDADLDELKRPPRETWPVGRAWCHNCFRFRRVSVFGKSATQCKPCLSKKAHEARVTREFALLPGQYEELMKLQDGRCAICRRKQVMRRMAVDHDHKTNEPRGLLCVSCNHDLLGAAHDSIDILRAAVAYMERPPLSGRWTPPEKVFLHRPGDPSGASPFPF